MHYTQAKAILSPQNGMIYTEAARTAAYTAIPEVSAIICSINLRMWK